MKRVPTLLAFCLLIALVFSVSCQKELACYTCNKPPVANAGADQKITSPVDSVRLDGSASTDADGTIKAWQWTMLAGPSVATIVNANSIEANAKNLIAGTYLFQLKVTDDLGAFALDTVLIIVHQPSLNQPPVANAGSDQTILLPTNTATLNAGMSTDPENNIATYRWSNISGPSIANIIQANEVVSQVLSLIKGVYKIQLTVTDASGLSSADTVLITVNLTTAVVSCGETNRPIINARLTPFAKLSEPSSGMAVAAAGNKIVFAGASLAGNPPDYGSAVVHIFDIVTQTWSTASLSVSRADLVAVAAGNKIFFAGGRLGSGGRLVNGGTYNYFSTVDIYDVSTNSWSVTNLSQPRAFIAAATVGNKVFFAGGEQEWPRPVSDRVDVYDIVTDTWSNASLSVQRNGLTAVAANNKIFFAGGSNQLRGTNNVTNIIDVYDNTSNSWSTTSLAEPKAFFAGLNVGNKIYWAGGDDASGTPTCKVEIKDLNTQTSSTAFLFQPFSYVTHEGLNAVVKDNKIIWFATLDPTNGNATDRFNIFDMNTDTWSIGLLPFRINGASIISVNNIIYVAGGDVNGKISDQVWKLEL